jgi:sulfotransferase family protein
VLGHALPLLRRLRPSPARRTFVFIVAYGRSGSTLLQSMLATVPRSHIMGENQDALAGLFQSYRSAREAKAGEGAQTRAAPGDPWRGVHRIDPERYNRKLASVFLEQILQVPRDATLVGFKEVRYFDHEDLEDYLDYIRTTFVPTLIIFNRRDPDAVAKSGWWRTHPDDIAEKVRRFDKRAEAYAALHPDCCVEARYEDYARDPRALESLFERLGARLDLKALDRVLATRLEH